MMQPRWRSHPHEQQQQQQQQQQRRRHLHTQHHEQPSPHPLAALLAASLPPVAYAFAYGSAVFEQPDLPEPHEAAAAAAASLSQQQHRRARRGEMAAAAAAGPMLDFVLVVDDAAAWHAANLRRNADHYSLVARVAGARGVAGAADALGAGAWFNAYVPLGGRVVKYGVASRAAFLADLAAWPHLYLAGRLHKPVLPLIGGDAGWRPGIDAAQQQQEQPMQQSSSSSSHNTTTAADADDAALRAALAANRASALRAALLLSPPAAPLPDVLRRVAGLSYSGDVRMGLAEDGRKVERIAAGSWAGLVGAYLPLLLPQQHDGGSDSSSGSGGSSEPLVPGLKLDGYDSGNGSDGSGLGGGAGGAPDSGGPLASYFTSRGVIVRRDASADAAAEALAALPAALLARVARRVGVRNDWAAAAAAATAAAAPVNTSSTSSSSSSPASIGGGAASEAGAAAAAWRRDVAWAAARSGRLDAALHGALAATVRASSARQAALGLLSAGPAHAVRYVGAKLAKAWGARRR